MSKQHPIYIATHAGERRHGDKHVSESASVGMNQGNVNSNGHSQHRCMLNTDRQPLYQGTDTKDCLQTCRPAAMKNNKISEPKPPTFEAMCCLRPPPRLRLSAAAPRSAKSLPVNRPTRLVTRLHAKVRRAGGSMWCLQAVTTPVPLSLPLAGAVGCHKRQGWNALAGSGRQNTQLASPHRQDLPQVPAPSMG